jgi:SPRY domain
MIPMLLFGGRKIFAIFRGDYSSTRSNGNRTTTTVTNGGSDSLDVIASGKVYVEMTVNSLGASFGGINIGVWGEGTNIGGTISGGSYLGSTSDSYAYTGSGSKVGPSGTSAAYGSSYTTADVIGIGYDSSNGEVRFWKNGVAQGVAFTLGGAARRITVGAPISGEQVSVTINAGQDAFPFGVPSGYQAGLWQ